MTLGHFRRWMLLPIGVASLVQGLYLWNIHRWTFHNGDATYYFNQAKLITQGHWFINPYLAGEKFIIAPSASHPPVTTLVLVLSDLLGAQSWLSHQVVMAVIFVVTVGICGVVGRHMAGGRAGVVVALVVGLYPYLWVNPAAVLSETSVLLITALLLWAALRFWERPRLRTAGEIGVYLALAALTRSEMIILTVLIGLPLVLLVRGLSRQDRMKNLAVMAGLCVVVLAPWVGRNMTTFHSPEYLSSQGGITLETANCDQTYYGGAEGWWWYPCAANVKIPAHADESDVDRAFRRVAKRYITHHELRLPAVVTIRVLRTWNLFRPDQQAHFDRLDARPVWVSKLGMYSFYVLAPFAIAGAVILRRRRVLVFPLLALVVTVTFAAATIYANGRYRSEGDLAVAILAGVGFEALLGVTWDRRRHRAVPERPEDSQPATGERTPLPTPS
jgi:hypothetical protein